MRSAWGEGRGETVLLRISRETWEEHKTNGECPNAAACCGCCLDKAREA